jgi:hypothetical protein
MLTENHTWIIITSLSGCIVALVLYIRHLFNKHSKDQKETYSNHIEEQRGTIERVVTAIVNNTNSNDSVKEALKNNTAMFDRLFNKIDSLRK